MHPSAEYKAWKDTAAWDIASFVFPCFEGPVGVAIVAVQKHKLRDLDNIIKPLLDALQAGRLIQNDNQVRELTAKWCDSKNLTKMAKDVRLYVYPRCAP